MQTVAVRVIAFLLVSVLWVVPAGASPAPAPAPVVPGEMPDMGVKPPAPVPVPLPAPVPVPVPMPGEEPVPVGPPLLEGKLVPGASPVILERFKFYYFSYTLSRQQ